MSETKKLKFKVGDIFKSMDYNGKYIIGIITKINHKDRYAQYHYDCVEKTNDEYFGVNRFSESSQFERDAKLTSINWRDVVCKNLQSLKSAK